MKSKIALIAVVFLSATILAGCGTKTNLDTETQNTQQTQNEQNPQATPGQGRPEMKEIDYATAAKTLGVTEEALKEAMGIDDTQQIEITPGAQPSGQPKRMDLATAAEKLGVTESALREALGMNEMGKPNNDQQAPSEAP